MKWRKWNNILHRDIGYLVVGLTIVYCISGIAVNHVQDWNPSYKIEKQFITIDPITSTERKQMVDEALSKLTIAEPLKDSFRPDEETLQLFFENKIYSIDIPTGKVMIETTQHRKVLFEMNQLHLNSPKETWTYIADLYALSLIVVTLTGLFVLKGKTGIRGRGAWMTSIGMLLPILYWVYYWYWA